MLNHLDLLMLLHPELHVTVRASEDPLVQEALDLDAARSTFWLSHLLMPLELDCNDRRLNSQFKAT